MIELEVRLIYGYLTLKDQRYKWGDHSIIPCLDMLCLNSNIENDDVDFPRIY